MEVRGYKQYLIEDLIDIYLCGSDLVLMGGLGKGMTSEICVSERKTIREIKLYQL